MSNERMAPSKKRINAEGDRLSNLPDELIHKILSFLELKHAIQTSELSSRWRHIWTSMPSLNFFRVYFHGTLSDTWLNKFKRFVTNVLSRRNNQSQVSSIMVSFHEFRQATIERILDYGFANNLQHLEITFSTEIENEFPFSVFRSESLKYLTLKGLNVKPSIRAHPTWELPALETLNLHYVTIYDDDTDKCAGLFSNCANLKNLTLKQCRFRASNGFYIHHPGLYNLTLKDGCKDVNVVTPQLKSLTVINCRRIHLISAPNLSVLHYKDYPPYDCTHYSHYEDEDDYYDEHTLKLSTELHLEKVDICIHYSSYMLKGYACKLICLLQQLHSVKYLTLNSESVKMLVELISHQPSPFVSLKSLKIYPYDLTQREVTLSTKVIKYLLDSSPGATMTMVSHEEIRAIMNNTTLRKLMIELHEVLEKMKKNSETNTAKVVEQVEVENHIEREKLKWQFGERPTDIERYWKNLDDQVRRGYSGSSRTISLQRKIQEALSKLPTSGQAKFQERYSGLCAEADAIMHSEIDRVKVFVRELATPSSHPSL